MTTSLIIGKFLPPHRGHAFLVETALGQVDLVRLDHFRGFEAYWEVPGNAKTAEGGRWVPGPGAAFFDALQEKLGPLPIVAENLGVITPAVEALRERYGFPGMAILQFAFGNDSSADVFKPHNYARNLVVYTGTHDNDTIAGWWNAGVGDSTRTAADVEAERALTRLYLGTSGRGSVTWLRNDYPNDAPSLPVPRGDDILGWAVGLGRQIGWRSWVRADYRRERRDSNLPGYDLTTDGFIVQLGTGLFGSGPRP